MISFKCVCNALPNPNSFLSSNKILISVLCSSLAMAGRNEEGGWMVGNKFGEGKLRLNEVTSSLSCLVLTYFSRASPVVPCFPNLAHHL